MLSGVVEVSRIDFNVVLSLATADVGSGLDQAVDDEAFHDRKQKQHGSHHPERCSATPVTI